jgi:hypothetical protein
VASLPGEANLPWDCEKHAGECEELEAWESEGDPSPDDICMDSPKEAMRDSQRRQSIEEMVPGLRTGLELRAG